ncbi:MAG: flagellar protein export ATPase FliI [Bacillota bacterium]
MKPQIDIASYRKIVEKADLMLVAGKVTRVVGLTVEVRGISASIGELCHILVPNQPLPMRAEVVGFTDNHSLLMPLGELGGIAPGCRVIPTRRELTIEIGPQLLGKVVDGLGQPLDGHGWAGKGKSWKVNNRPPNPLERRRITQVLETGVKAIDSFLTCGEGQRVGIFAGSGVGKSTLLGMIARQSSADVNVIGLIGERGREVLDFLERDLGPEGLKKSVVVVATSDQPALLRLKGAFIATAIAEYFRDEGKRVLLMLDSVTRFAMSQREVGLAVGEPPTTRGYTPSVFALLPRLLERSGNSLQGSITGLYTVLVDGDDMNEPIADAVRGILDGHIVLSRELANKNHFPAIDVLKSISRLMPDIISEQHWALAGRLRDLMAAYDEVEDLVNIGAYQQGTNPRVDAAIKYFDQIQSFLRQGTEEHLPFTETLRQMEDLVSA